MYMCIYIYIRVQIQLVTNNQNISITYWSSWFGIHAVLTRSRLAYHFIHASEVKTL